MSYPKREVYMRLISKDALGAYMEARGLSNRELARKAGSESYRSTIGHLRSGERNTCGPKIAGAIEKALGAPPGSLFLVEVANATDANRRQPAP